MVFYTRRIRTLYVDTKDINLDLVFGFLDRLNKLSPFPSLRKLVLSEDLEDSGHGLFLFPISAPNLEALELYEGTLPEISAATFLSTLSSESPNLKSILIEPGHIWTNAVFDVLPCFRKLQQLNVQDMACKNPIRFLKNCASCMTSLRSLKIHLASFLLTDDFGQPVSSKTLRTLGLITFGLLSDLSLTGNFLDVKNMLNILLVPKLDNLDLAFQASSWHDDFITDIGPFMEGFLTSNGQHLKDGLRTLSLQIGSTELNIEGSLNCFKAFTELDSLHLEASGFHISTSSLANFLHEHIIWSNLTSLSLSNGNDISPSDDKLSIAALPLLADTFPKLLHLRIAISNPDQAVMKTVAADPVLRHHSLETLRFLNLPRDWVYSTSSAVAFASFLHQVFPELEMVGCPRWYEWMRNVQEMLKKEQSANVHHPPSD